MATPELQQAFLVGRDAYLVDTLAFQAFLDTATSTFRMQVAQVGSQVWQDWLTVDAIGHVTIPSATITTGFTPGSVVFAGAAGVLSQDNAHFFWDATTGALGLGLHPKPNHILTVGAPDGTDQGIVVHCTGAALQFKDFAETILYGQLYSFSTGAGGLGLTTNGNTMPLRLNEVGGPTGVGGVTAPTAHLHIAAGTAAASFAPLKFTSGTLLGTPEAGAVEFLTDKWYGTITTGAARKTFAFLESPLFTTASNDGLFSYYSGATLRGIVGPSTWATNFFTFQNATLAESANNFALSQDDAGNTYINAVTGKTLYLRINNATHMSFTNSVINMAYKLAQYNAITTAGWGVPAIYGSGYSAAQTAAVASVATYTVGAADGLFDVRAYVNVTTSTLHTIAVQVAYTDETNTAQTLTLTFSQLAGTLVTSITNATGAGPYEGVPVTIYCKASTSITIKTTGTFTTVTYNVAGSIAQHK
jgi:hypothetical protein